LAKVAYQLSIFGAVATPPTPAAAKQMATNTIKPIQGCSGGVAVIELVRLLPCQFRFDDLQHLGIIGLGLGCEAGDHFPVATDDELLEVTPLS
jgi:hypothetical protein